MTIDPELLKPDPTGTWPLYDGRMMVEYGGRFVAAVGRYMLCDTATQEEAVALGLAAVAEHGLNPADLRVYAICRPEDAWF